MLWDLSFRIHVNTFPEYFKYLYSFNIFTVEIKLWEPNIVFRIFLTRINQLPVILLFFVLTITQFCSTAVDNWQWDTSCFTFTFFLLPHFLRCYCKTNFFFSGNLNIEGILNDSVD